MPQDRTVSHSTALSRDCFRFCGESQWVSSNKFYSSFYPFGNIFPPLKRRVDLPEFQASQRYLVRPCVKNLSFCLIAYTMISGAPLLPLLLPLSVFSDHNCYHGSLYCVFVADAIHRLVTLGHRRLFSIDFPPPFCRQLAQVAFKLAV